jgi:hypothetical protein
MANDIYSILASYFRYQRDLGAEEIIFGGGPAAAKILSGRAGAVAGGGTGAVSRAPEKRAGGGYGGYGAPQKAGAAAGGAASPLSRLSKIRPADALGLKKFERGAAPAGAQSARREKLAGLYREAAGCGMCALSRSRAKVVFGSGSADGWLLVVGDMPSPEDEAAGRPFQGEAGG